MPILSLSSRIGIPAHRTGDTGVAPHDLGQCRYDRAHSKFHNQGGNRIVENTRADRAITGRNGVIVVFLSGLPKERGPEGSKALGPISPSLGIAVTTNCKSPPIRSYRDYSLLIIFQAMDAAGKDGAISHVMSGVNPQDSE